eukprot:2020046-Alexandrium_andersonii.AAC.1
MRETYMQQALERTRRALAAPRRVRTRRARPNGMFSDVPISAVPGTARLGARQEVSCKPPITESLRLCARFFCARMPQPQTRQWKKEACRFLQGA